MPTSTCFLTTSATASAITLPGSGGSGPSFSRANSTSVTACERGRLPTCVVRMRSLLRSTAMRLAEHVVGVMVAGQPAPELAVRVLPAQLVDPVRVRVVERELADHAVGILGIDRAAVAVLEHIHLRRLVAGLLQPLLDAGLGLGIDVQCDVVEGRGGNRRGELGLVLLVGELEEGQRAAVTDAEEAVAVGALLAEQLVLLAPRGHQRQADDVLVEMAGGLEGLRGGGGVVQTRRQRRRDGHVQPPCWNLLSNPSLPP